MDLRDIIREYRASNGLSQRAFAARCLGVSAAYISIIEMGANPTTGKPTMPSIEKLDGIARGMNMTLEELLDKMGVQRAGSVLRPSNALPYTPARAMVPVVGSVRCGPGGALAYTDLQGAELADVNDPAEYFYLRAVGDSMEPRIFAGDLVLVHSQPVVDSGDLAVVIIDEEEGVLKKYIERDGAIILQSFNSDYPPRVFVGEEKAKLRIAGRAVQLLRRW